MKYQYRIVRIDKKNYPLFEDMLFWRQNGFVCRTLNGTIPASVKKELKNPNRYLYAAQIEGRLVAFVSVSHIQVAGKWKNSGHLYVDELWVAPDFRGLGLASILMTQTKMLQNRLGVSDIRLCVGAEDETTMAFLFACGFETNEQLVFSNRS